MQLVYQLRIERQFCAAHALQIKGVREPTHGHNWRVRVIVTGAALDEDGLLCDFHLLEAKLDAILAPLHNADLNGTPPFDRVNPTAEHVARHIAVSMEPHLPRGVRLASASVTEAPGCEASYVPEA